jgi:hypothetical protein
MNSHDPSGKKQVLTHFQSKVVALGHRDLSADEVYRTIEEGAHQWTTGKLRLFADLQFQYEEDQEHALFVLPYIWSLVHRHSLIAWDASKTRLLEAHQMEVPYNLPSLPKTSS